ncbi:hypothetical protein GCM10009547_26490 [Sporichthya brevicatena]|uniref:Uncharacterized protein n=1 Tax=Sporichthya brevicatena TaxID=171442 RepID=A0ABN1GX25_9ACTN
MTLSTKTRRRALVGAVVAGVALTGVAVTSASADHTGRFIPKSDLPQASKYTPWTAAKPKPGLPNPMYTCIKGILPAASSSHQSFSSDGSAEAREIITITKNTKAAKKAVNKLRKAVRECDKKVSDVTGIERVGKWDKVENGLTVHAVYYAPPGSEYNFTLFGIGRDGKKVVVTTFGDMGKKKDAPLAAFSTTAKRALEKAF